MNNTEDGSLPLEIGGVVAGGAGLAAGVTAAPDMMLGRKTLYHGTSVGNARSIEKEGFKPSTGLGGASEGINKKEYIEQSKGKTHFTSAKPLANSFADFVGTANLTAAQEQLDAAKERFNDARMDPDMEPRLLEDIERAEQHVKSMSDVKKGKVLKVNVPYHMYDEMEVDPHILQPNLPKEFGGRLVGATYTEPIDPKYVVNGENGMTIAQRLAQSAQDFPGYIKRHPGRFASGAGLIGGGAGLTGYAGKRIYDRLVGDEDA